jgi:hypothetical protein
LPTPLRGDGSCRCGCPPTAWFGGGQIPCGHHDGSGNPVGPWHEPARQTKPRVPPSASPVPPTPAKQRGNLQLVSRRKRRGRTESPSTCPSPRRGEGTVELGQPRGGRQQRATTRAGSNEASATKASATKASPLASTFHGIEVQRSLHLTHGDEPLRIEGSRRRVGGWHCGKGPASGFGGGLVPRANRIYAKQVAGRMAEIPPNPDVGRPPQ